MSQTDDKRTKGQNKNKNKTKLYPRVPFWRGLTFKKFKPSFFSDILTPDRLMSVLNGRSST